MLKETLEEHFAKFDTTLRLTERPAVVLVVGVNGVGKTTTIGKFAKFLQRYRTHRRRRCCRHVPRRRRRSARDLGRARGSGDRPPAAARARTRHPSPSRRSSTPSATGTEIVLVDTAGRLHTKGGLMDELGKIRRVIEKQAPISEVLLVLDATTGQNGVMQAQAFLEHAGVTGLVLTKLDGSAKGGFVLAVQERTGIPVKLLGQGEGIGRPHGLHPARVRGSRSSTDDGTTAPSTGLVSWGYGDRTRLLRTAGVGPGRVDLLVRERRPRRPDRHCRSHSPDQDDVSEAALDVAASA